MQKQLSDLTIIELKSLAYDQMVQIEICQNNLKILNEELNRKLNSQPKENFIEPLPPGSIQTV